MNPGNKRQNPGPVPVTVKKKSKSTDCHCTSIASTRSKSKEKSHNDKENIQPTQSSAVVSKTHTQQTYRLSSNISSDNTIRVSRVYRQSTSDKIISINKSPKKPLTVPSHAIPVRKKSVTFDLKEARGPLSDIPPKNKTVQGTGTKPKVYEKSVKQNTVKESKIIIQSKPQEKPKQITKKQTEIIQTVDKRFVTLRKSVLNVEKDKLDKEWEEYKTFSNENLFNCISYEEVISRKTIKYAKSVLITHKVSPFEEREDNGKEEIISEGIPSLKKKTLKKEVCQSSGFKGVVDLDPYLNKVHCSILYSHYLNEMITILLLKEKKYVLQADFIKRFTAKSSPRTTVVNWLLKVHQYFKSDSGVFFISVRLYDRLLNLTNVPTNIAQLVGIVAYWIACKCNDIIKIPKVKTLALICRDEFSINQVLKVERKVIRFLKFDFNVEEPMIFVRYYIYKMELENSEIVSFCANYILDCLFLDSIASTIVLSLQAAAAVHLSLQFLDIGTQCWNCLINLPGYYPPQKFSDLQSYMQTIIQTIQDPECEFREPYLKYCSEKYGAVSLKLLKKQVAT